MSPEPFVRWHAAIFGFTLVMAAGFASPLAAGVIAAIAAALVSRLAVKYRRDVRDVEIPPHRDRLDHIVAGDARAALLVGLVTAAALFLADFSPPDTWLAPATYCFISVAAAGVYVSSLFDWYIILPRVSGLLGQRPCRPGVEARVSFPRTWRETTRWWYIHRIVAALFVRFGLSYAIVFTAQEYLGLSQGAEIVGGALLGALASYLRAVPQGVMQAGNPSVVVGQCVIAHEVEYHPRFHLSLGPVRIPFPFFPRALRGPSRHRAYVRDVALEGVKLAATENREGTRHLSEPLVFEKTASSVRLADIEGATSATDAFSGCDTRCSGINYYCIENPRCFEPK